MRGAETNECLTQQQLTTAQRLYSSMDPAQHYDDALLPGTELGWTSVALGAALSETMYSSVVYPGKSWHIRDFDPRDIAIVRDRYGPLLNDANPDLSKFAARGGKLIIYSGLADTLVPANHTIHYVDKVRSTMGGAADKMMALFLAPGMGHCAPGDGFVFLNDGAGVDSKLNQQEDLAAALQNWVEGGSKPEQIIAMRPDVSAGVPKPTTRTRPMCAYPKVARWTGKGDKDVASNYTCAAPSI